MSLYEKAFRHVLWPAYEAGLRRRKTLSYLREYQSNQWLDSQALQALQWKKLQRLVAHCWRHVPYYRQQWQTLGIRDPADIATRADYARLPVLTKQDIRAHFDDLVADNQGDGLLFKTTGGSTGEPLRFGYTRESYERRVAVMHRGYGWAGAQPGRRTSYLWGMPGKVGTKDRLYHAAFNRQMLDAFDMGDRTLPLYAAALARYRPLTIVAYVAPIVKLAEWMLANNFRMPPPQRILTAAEALHQPQRELLQRVFGCPVYNTYGCREFMLIASECKQHRLHATADHLLLEQGERFDDTHASPRALLVTDLHNLGMPLLRYANGDLVRMGQDGCSCGLGLPVVERVEGRRLDALRTLDGRFVPGEFVVYAFLCARGVRRYQAIQRSVGQVDVLVEKDIDYDPESMEGVRAELVRVLGQAMTLNFIPTDAIPVTPTGKHRVTISELP